MLLQVKNMSNRESTHLPKDEIKHITNLINHENKTEYEIKHTFSLTDAKIKCTVNLININNNDDVTIDLIKQMANISDLKLGYNNIIASDGVNHMFYLTNIDFYCDENITDDDLIHMNNLSSLNIGRNKEITDY